MDECKPLVHGHSMGHGGGGGAGFGARHARPRCCAPGRAVHLDPMKPTLTAPGSRRSNLEHENLLSNFAFNFNLRRYSLVEEGEAEGESNAREARRTIRAALGYDGDSDDGGGGGGSRERLQQLPPPSPSPSPPRREPSLSPPRLSPPPWLSRPPLPPDSDGDGHGNEGNGSPPPLPPDGGGVGAGDGDQVRRCRLTLSNPR